MERQYVILSDINRAFPTDPFGRVGTSPRTAESAAAAAPEISTVTLTNAGLLDAVRAPEVSAVAPVMPTHLITPVPADEAGAEASAAPGTGPTWGVHAVGADHSERTGAGVTAAVLDTGVDAAHPAFTGVELIQQDFSGDGNGDVQGHGTHCAGTIFGRDVEGTRIGVARGVTKALIGKVLADNGSGSSEMLFQGIQWAVREGADVVSMSLGFDFPGLVTELLTQGWPPDLATSAALEGYRANLRMFDALMEMIKHNAAFGRGTVVAAAAGNESRRHIHPDYEIAVSIPAAADGVVSVGALQQVPGGLGIARFSNTFPLISAPGVDVWSAQAGTEGLVSFNGTSMACPHVAGVLALWWEEVLASPLPSTATTVFTRLMAGADTGVLVPGVDIADRGVGIAKAP